MGRLERAGLEQRPSWELAGEVVRVRRERDALASELQAASRAAAQARADAELFRIELLAARRAVEKLLGRTSAGEAHHVDRDLTLLPVSRAFLRAVVGEVDVDLQRR